MPHLYATLLLSLLLGFAKMCGEKTSPAEKSTLAPVVTGKIAQLLPIEYTDSLLIRQHLQQYQVNSLAIKQVQHFYADTIEGHAPYTLIWSKHGRIHALAGMFVNLMNHYEQEGLPMQEYHAQTLEQLYLEGTDSLNQENITGKPQRQALDVLLTAAFFKYAPLVWKGQIDPRKAKWYVTGKTFDYLRILISLLDGRLTFKTFEPLHREYGQLRKALQTYRRLAQAGGWPSLPKEDYQNLTIGDRSGAVFALKKRLQLTQDIDREATIDSTYDAQLTQGLMKFQQRHGLPATGKLAAKTLAQLNVPIQQRISQILLNMERWRWVPAGKPGPHLVVNIPEYVLHVMEDNRQIWQMDVIVGKAATNTTIFDDEVENVVLNPYWGVPRSIAVNEILPKLRAGKNYLPAHQMEVFVAGRNTPVNPASINWKNVNASNFRYSFRQKPGPKNPLGRVKFLFPNTYDIYLHDTPNHGLFTQAERGFSHGCIRLSDPFRLQAYLMNGDSQWTTAKVKQVLQTGKEQYIRLKTKIPVTIVYFTAWQDNSGNLQFREDIYGHDARLAADLFQKPEPSIVRHLSKP